MTVVVHTASPCLFMLRRFAPPPNPPPLEKFPLAPESAA